MRILLIIFFLCCKTLFAQDIAGQYSYRGEDLTVRSDSSFYSTWYVGCIVEVWVQGKWIKTDKCITFYPILVFDTLDINHTDSLIYSKDTLSQRLTTTQFKDLEGLGVYQVKYDTFNLSLQDKEGKLYLLNSKGKKIKNCYGREKRISFRNNRIDKPPIVLFSWQKKYRHCAYIRSNK
ncbi:MAG: hypothetical protein CFE21_08870 [Bacteroidetes bacterium B1(2017)]|nr:MAG: hypothetical protein CFE21_08870 [Bacteroidetes bacterium B1(2017)]